MLDFMIGIGLCVEMFCSDGVDFIDEDDGWGVFMGYVEDVMDYMRIFIEVFLDEFGVYDVDEVGGGGVGDGFDKYGFVSIGGIVE